MLLLKWKNGFKSLAKLNDFWLLRYVNLSQTKCSSAANIWCFSLGTGKIYEGPVAKALCSHASHYNCFTCSMIKGCLGKKKKGKKEKNQLFTENVYRPKEDEDLERQLCFFLSVNLLKEPFNCWINVVFSCQSAFFSPSQNIKIHVTGWFKALVMEHRRLVFGGFFSLLCGQSKPTPNW